MTKDKKRGPKADELHIDGDWKEAAKKAVKKKRPPGGWPDKGKKKDAR